MEATNHNDRLAHHSAEQLVGVATKKVPSNISVDKTKSLGRRTDALFGFP